MHLAQPLSCVVPLLRKGTPYLDQKGSEKQTNKILAFLEAMWLPKQVAIICYKEHQKGDFPKGPWEQNSQLGCLESSPRTRGASPGLGYPAQTQISLRPKLHTRTQISLRSKLHTRIKNKQAKRKRCQQEDDMVGPSVQEPHTPHCSRKANGCQSPPGRPSMDIQSC